MSKMFKLIFMLALLLSPGTLTVSAQDNGAVLKIKNEPLPQVLRQLEMKTDYRFLYLNDDLRGYTFTGDLTLKDINSTMAQLLDGKPLGYNVNQQYVTVTKQGSTSATSAYIVRGKVVDENGAELPGVNIRVQGGKTYAVTDINGIYTIEVHANDVLRFTFIGYREEIVAVKGKKVIDVDLRPDAHTLKDVQVVAFGTQKKESVVSSITSIRPGDLKTSSSDLTTSFAGRIPGMVAWQTGGMPGAMTESEMNTKFYVRGITSFQSGANTDPLILIDGVESTKLDLARLTRSPRRHCLCCPRCSPRPDVSRSNWWTRRRARPRGDWPMGPRWYTSRCRVTVPRCVCGRCVPAESRCSASTNCPRHRWLRGLWRPVA